jgi:hypothetical protein
MTDTLTNMPQAPEKMTNSSGEYVLVQLRFKCFGITKKADKTKLTTEADKDRLNVSKRIIDSKTYNAISKHDWETREWIKRRALPSMFADGIYMVKPSIINKLYAYLEQRKQEREALVAEFSQVYQYKVEEAKKALANQFNPKDYPPTDEVVRRFGMYWMTFVLKTPDQVGALNKELFESEQRRLASVFAIAEQNGIRALRLKAKELTDHMVERLTPAEDGKKKIIRTSVLENLQEFLDTFQDVSNDQELGAQVKRLGEVLKGVDAPALRSSEKARDYTKARFQELQGNLDQLVEDAPERFLDLD